MKDIKTALMNGEIIEDYPDDFLFQAVLFSEKTLMINLFIFVSVMRETAEELLPYISLRLKNGRRILRQERILKNEMYSL